MRITDAAVHSATTVLSLMPPREPRSRGHIEELPGGSCRAVVFVGLAPLSGCERRIRETAKTHAEAGRRLVAVYVPWSTLAPTPNTAGPGVDKGEKAAFPHAPSWS